MLHVERRALDSFLARELILRGIEFNIVDDISDVPDNKSEIALRFKHENCCRPCPATKVYRCCNYYTIDVMEGCPFDCSYCILQTYLPHKRIEVSANTAAIEGSIRELIATGHKCRVGTGELSDSLALDHIFPFTKIIAPMVNDQDCIQFEFKTKSANVSNLLDINPRNMVISWSLNPQSTADTEENGAASIKDRLNAAKICAEAGYRVAFHFDPVIYTDNYMNEYRGLLNDLFNVILEMYVEYVSISTFRAPASLLDKMRERSSVSNLLKGDIIVGLDGKYRYFKPLRLEMLKFMTMQISQHWKNVFVYYCMEDQSIWHKIMGYAPEDREDFESLFPYRSIGL